MFDLNAHARIRRQFDRNLSLYGGPTPLSLGLYSVLKGTAPPTRRGLLAGAWHRLRRWLGLAPRGGIF